MKRDTSYTYIKNYSFTYDFGGAWGNCNVLFTCVSGHMTECRFNANIEKGDWHNPSPKSLFTAPVKVSVGEVSFPSRSLLVSRLTTGCRIKKPSPEISSRKPEMPMLFSYGLIVIVKGSILEGKSGLQLGKAMLAFK